MDEIIAKIDMTIPGNGIGTVVNTQVINPGDNLDPNYLWILLTGLSCSNGDPVDIGCTYDGNVFTSNN